MSSEWFPDSELFFEYPGVRDIADVLDDRVGFLDLKKLMCYAVRNDNILRLKPNDPNYDYLRVELLEYEEDERKEEFSVLMNHCLKWKMMSKHEDEQGEYLYFHILDYMFTVHEVFDPSEYE